MDETNELLDAVVNYVEDKSTPLKFDDGIVQRASSEVEKSCQELFKFLKQVLNEKNYKKAVDLLKDFNLKQLSYCQEEHSLYYKEGFCNCLKLIITSLT